MKATVARLGVVLFFCFGVQAKASVFELTTLETTMAEPVFKALATSLAFRPVEGPTTLGSKWGFSLGVSGSAVHAASVASVITNLPTTFIPNLDVQLGIGLPKGITLELVAVPSLNINGTSFSKYGGAFKLTLNETLLKKFSLVTVAIRAQYSTSSLGYSQPVTGGTVAVDYRGNVWGASLVAGKFIGLIGFGIEPYVGVGFLRHDGSIGATGTASLFGASFPAGTTSISGNGFGFTYHAGLMLKLGVIGIAAQYENIFGIESYGGKVSIRI